MYCTTSPVLIKEEKFKRPTGQPPFKSFRNKFHRVNWSTFMFNKKTTNWLTYILKKKVQSGHHIWLTHVQEEEKSS